MNLDKKEYELKDHLGNVRVAIGEMKIPTSTRGVAPFVVDEKSINDYYPYGMLIADRSWSSAGYRYGYNGKENDNEVKGTGNSIDYGERRSDPRIGRFDKIDPDVQKYTSQSPYINANDNPILFIDENGKGAKQSNNRSIYSAQGMSDVLKNIGNFTKDVVIGLANDAHMMQQFFGQQDMLQKDKNGNYSVSTEIRDLKGNVHNPQDIAKMVLQNMAMSVLVESKMLKSIMEFAEITAIRSAEDVVVYGNNNCFLHGTNVVESITSNDRNFVRVYTEGINKPKGKWLLNPKDIEGLNAKQIQEKFALPEVPNKIVDVNVPKGTKLRTGIVGPQETFKNSPKGGGTQFQILDELDNINVSNPRDIKK